MVSGLSPTSVVNVQVILSPMAVPMRNFGALLIIGPTEVIPVSERLRPYASSDEMLGDGFASADPEVKAAEAFFAQRPRPAQVYIGCYANDADDHGLLTSGVIAGTTQAGLLAQLRNIRDGSFIFTIDGVERTITDLDFHWVEKMGNVAAVLNSAIVGTAVSWNPEANVLTFTSDTTGENSDVSVATDATEGTPVAGLLKLRAADGAVAGTGAERPVDAVIACAQKSSAWYGVMIADDGLSATNHREIADYVEGLSPTRIYGLTTSQAGILNSADDTDLASTLKRLGYSRTFIQYSSNSPYAVASLFGRAFTVDFAANNSMITLKFKQQPTIAPEVLTSAQASVLKWKNVNVLAAYNNDTAILQEGVMSNGYFFDEVHGTDWLGNALETSLWNLLYTSQTKIPQTDEGVHQLVTAVESVCVQAMTNGFLAAGLWNGPQLGTLKPGDMVAKGYYVYAPLIRNQLQADREARRAPTIQVAAKLAGAVHFASVIVNVNR